MKAVEDYSQITSRDSLNIRKCKKLKILYKSSYIHRKCVEHLEFTTSWIDGIEEDKRESDFSI